MADCRRSLASDERRQPKKLLGEETLHVHAELVWRCWQRYEQLRLGCEIVRDHLPCGRLIVTTSGIAENGSGCLV